MSSSDLLDEEKKAPDAKYGGSFSEEKERSGVKTNNLLEDDDENSLWKPENDPEDSRIKKALLNKKTAAGGGLVSLLIAAILALLGISHGPAQFIHKSQLLQRFHLSSNESFGDDRSAKFFLYALSGKAAKGRLGALSNQVADKYEKDLNNSGLRSVYQSGSGRFIGYQVLDQNKARGFLFEMERDGVPRTRSLSGTDINGKPIQGNQDFVNLQDNKFKRRRSATRTAVKATHTSRLTSRLGSRLLIKRGGINPHPWRSVVRKRTDDYFKWREKHQLAKADEYRTGKRVNPDAPRDPNNPNTGPNGPERSRILTKLRSFMNSAKGPVIAAAAICGVKEFSAGIDAQNYENQLTLMRMGMGAVAMGDQARSNHDFSLDIMSVYDDYHYDEVTKTSWKADPGIQQELGQEPTGTDYNADVKPGSRQKPVVFKVADAFPIPSVSSVSVCDAINAPSNIPGIKQALDAFGALIDAGLKSFGIPTSDELMSKAIDYFSTGGVDVLAQGAKRGGLENIGVRLAANDMFLSMGGRALSAAEEVQAKQYAAVENSAEFKYASTYDKYFNVYESRSMAAKLFDQSPKNMSQLASSIAWLPTSFSVMGSSLLAGSGKVSAAATYDYGFPMIGYSAAEQTDPAYEDPFVNADYIESGSTLQTLNNTYGNKCFGMTVSDTGELVYDKAVDQAKVPADCNDTTNKDLIKYRFYLADMVSAHAKACYAGVEASCQQLYGKQSASAATSAPAPGTPTSAAPSTPAPAGSAQSLAQQMLANPKITYWTNRGVNTRDVVVAISQGKPAYTTCGNASNKTTEIDLRVLQFLVEAGQQTNIAVNALSDKCHSNNSNHYKGKAVDLEDNVGDLRIIDPIARKYGGRKNGETTHHHYDFL